MSARQPVDVDGAMRELLAALAGPLAPAAAALPQGTGGDGEVPVTLGQRQLWFLQQIAPGATTYNVCTALRLRGPLRAGALGGALTDLETRHPALRTNILTGRRGRPRGIVRPAGTPAALDVLEAPAPTTAPGDREAAVQRLALDRMAVPFDLADGPLARHTLLRFAPDDHALVMVVHHAVVDGWSMRVVLRDLATLYSARAGGPAADLPRLPHSYADFAAWQTGPMQDTPQYTRALDHWRHTLDGAPAETTLPADRPRPAAAGPAGRSLHFDLPQATTREVVALAARRRCTPFAVAFAAFTVWLATASGTRDLVVGVPSAGRPYAELGDVVGYFVNLLPLRIRLREDGTFAGTVRDVHAAVADGLDHDLPPFERIVKTLGIRRDPGRQPLAQVMFQLVDDATVGGESDGWHGLDVEECRVRHDDDPRFDVELDLRHDGRDGIQATLTLDSRRYRQETAEQARDGYRELLATLCRHPDEPLGPLLAAAPPTTTAHDEQGRERAR